MLRIQCCTSWISVELIVDWHQIFLIAINHKSCSLIILIVFLWICLTRKRNTKRQIKIIIVDKWVSNSVYYQKFDVSANSDSSDTSLKLTPIGDQCCPSLTSERSIANKSLFEVKQMPIIEMCDSRNVLSNNIQSLIHDLSH